MATAQAQAVEEVNEDSTQSGREMSQIVFPYQDLDEAVAIAKAIHTLSGSTAQYEQIAAQTGMSPKSSGFRTNISTAKIFGLISTSQGAATLSPLGIQICDPQQEKAARVQAFLRVPLYNAIYEKFKGASLPPTTGLEAAIAGMGVAKKQTERARQIFQRSAQQAGFFQFGNDRLVLPAIKQSAATPIATEPIEDEPEKKKKSKDEDEDELNPFIKGLLTKLPKPDSEWPQDARAKWLETAANIFDLLYKNSDDNNRVISIRLEKDSAKQ